MLPIPTLLAEPQSLAARNRLKVVTLTTSAESYARSYATSLIEPADDARDRHNMSRN